MKLSEYLTSQRDTILEWIEEYRKINPHTEKDRNELVKEWINLYAKIYQDRSKTNIENTLHNLEEEDKD
jgi:hypothetical protein